MGLKVLTEVAVNRVLVIGGFSLNKISFGAMSAGREASKCQVA